MILCKSLANYKAKFIADTQEIKIRNQSKLLQRIISSKKEGIRGYKTARKELVKSHANSSLDNKYFKQLIK